MDTTMNNRPLFIVCAVHLVGLYGLNFILDNCSDKLGLVTANTLITNTYVWNLVTACFYEVSVVKVVFDLLSVFILTKNLPIPSYEQYSLYCLFTILACTIATSVYCFVGFYILAKEEILITPIYGIFRHACFCYTL
jgi:hypothetical protein